MQWISRQDVALNVAFCHQNQINGNLRNFYDNLSKNTDLYGEVLLNFRLYHSTMTQLMPFLSWKIFFVENWYEWYHGIRKWHPLFQPHLCKLGVVYVVKLGYHLLYSTDDRPSILSIVQYITIGLWNGVLRICI